MVLGGIWFSAPRPTANRSSVLPDETEDRELVFLRIYSRFDQSGSTRTFFSGFKFEHIFQKIWITPAVFFSLYPTLCISLGLLCRLLTQTAGKYFFLKFQAFTGTFQTLKTQTEIQAFSRISSNCHKPRVIRESLNGTNCSFAN